MIKGIDVSRWQGTIDWPTVKGNVDFAIIKIGGSDDGFYMDGMAQRNSIEARSAQVPCGFYVYLGGSHSIQEEVSHIKNLVSQIGGLRAGEFLALDWEEHHATDEVGYLTGIVEGLSGLFASPLVYMSLSRALGNDWSSLVTRNCPLWVASWGNNDDIPDSIPVSGRWPAWSFWQFSSTGSVAGVPARVCLDNFNGSIDDFKKLGLSQPVVLPLTAPVSLPVILASTVSEYSVVPGDSLSSIASRYGHSWQDLYALNRDRVSQPNRIYPGQKLRVWAAMVGQPINNPPLPTTTHRTHTVENGENLSVIASRYGLPSWQTVYAANRDIIGADPNLIKPGQVLVIP